MAVLSTCLASSAAMANGRFPRAERLIEDPSNPKRLLLASTYGLLTTDDGGGAWYDTCEAAFTGLGTYGGDPLVELVAGGGILVDYQSGIRRSSDGCSWSTTLSVPDSGFIPIIADYSVDALARQRAVAVATTYVDGGRSSSLFESDDAGVTWTALGAPLPMTAYTIDLDPSDANHIFVSGLSDAGQGVLAISADHAVSWTTTPIPGTGASDVPYIAAIHPRDPMQIFVRTDSTVVIGGSPSPNDALLHTRDGGATWTAIVRKKAKLLGFALSPDASQIAVGYGNPAPQVPIASSELGVFRALTADYQFSPVLVGESVTCLTWTQAGTYACTAIATPQGLEELVLFPGDALSQDAAAPMRLMRLSDVRGPPPCCAAVTSVCDWTTTCAALNACGDGGDNAPVCDGGAGAPGPTVGDAGAPPGTGSGRRNEPDTGHGCGCGHGSSDTISAAVGFASVVAAFRRRMRRSVVRGDRQSW
jgi:photosystem II stability/assembly factor-like uncharacterized protein